MDDTVTGLMVDASRHRSVSAISRDLGHEIKSVLNVLSLNLALLSRVASSGRPSPADVELAARSGDAMRRELKRLDGYIEGLVRAQAPDDEAGERVNLGTCGEQLGLLVAARAARQRVTVRLEVPDAEVLIDACPVQLQHALLNLTVNALDAMPDGGTLDLQVTADGRIARFSVTDSGPGLPDALRADPWQVRFTPGGTRIGLAVANALVHAHGGRIVYDQTSSGRGARFTAEFARLASG